MNALNRLFTHSQILFCGGEDAKAENDQLLRGHPQSHTEFAKAVRSASRICDGYGVPHLAVSIGVP